MEYFGNQMDHIFWADICRPAPTIPCSGMNHNPTVVIYEESVENLENPINYGNHNKRNCDARCDVDIVVSEISNNIVFMDARRSQCQTFTRRDDCGLNRWLHISGL